MGTSGQFLFVGPDPSSIKFSPRADAYDQE